MIADQHRWDFLGGGGNGHTSTPALDRMAHAGMRFSSAYCTSPLCCPSRAAIASGRYGMNTGCFTNLHELPPGTPSFVSQFRHSGYHTCAIGKTHMEIHAYDSDLLSDAHRAYMDSLGWDEVCEISGNGMLKTGIRCAYSEFLRHHGMFDQVLVFYRNWHYFMDAGKGGDHSFVPHEWPFAPEYQETAFVGDRAVDWLRRWDGDRPFFLHVGFAGPHSPIEPLPEFMDLYRDQEEVLPWGVNGAPDWTLEGRRGYRAMISQIDHHLGGILACLAEKGWLDNTIVVYTADHGEMAGDHGRFGKTCFYEPSVRVPLLLAGPGVRREHESSALVELVDLGKTLCELCAVEAHAWDQGVSLLPVLRGESTAAPSLRDSVYAEMGCDKMLYDGRYKLMWGDPASDTRKLGRLHLDKPVNIPPSPFRLYDLDTDPCELEDLGQDPANHDLLLAMVEKLLIRLNQNSQTQPFKSRGVYRPLS
jgi:arylsulfatase